ncbi:glycosyltransferase family 2 protein [Gramella sp. GC03-9]|uniref:Glycosyltransferase family 2 protein n=1 Tax=Christiangramia oceanisediminis TaxID=2920386 RepID=A0A9X2I980_9FLAO|nr:glycosyltransferase family A protein [Gramella oceanisediminis]MCP9198318.1 glycosyltransferase family 2 protein [Gramella oceanisediminis]
MKPLPLISIIVPCYNQGVYLDECLRSVIEQNYTNWECIIINDGSSDETEEIAAKWISLDDRFIYLCQNNRGVSAARNTGIFKARGTYILPLDADDKISVDYLELAIAEFTRSSNLKVITSYAKKFGKINSFWELENFSLQQLAKQNIIFSSSLFKKEDWEKIGGYDENLSLGLEDWEFWISLLKYGGNVYRIEKVCFFYRIKANSRNMDLSSDDFSSIHKYISVKHADFFVKYLGSFHELHYKLNKLENEYISKLQNKKYILDLFCKNFFGFTLFGRIK